MDDINRYYSVLELDPGASPEEIKQAYRRLAKNWHPDRFAHDATLRQQAEEKIKAINEAYDYLKERSPEDLQATPVEPAPPTVVKDFQTVIKTKASNGESHYNLGVEHVQAGRYKEAIEAFSAAIRANAHYIEAYRYRGFVYSVMGLELSAESDLTKAKALTLEQTQFPSPAASPAPAPTAPSPDPPTLTQTLFTHTTPTAIALTSDGKLLVSGNRDGTIQLWNLKTGQSFYQLTEHSTAISTLVFSADGKRLISGSQDGVLKVWLLRSAAVLKTLVGHQRGIISAAIAPDQRTLVSVSGDGNLRRWDLNTGSCLQTLSLDSGTLWAIALSTDGQIVASADDTDLSLYTTLTGELLRRWSLPTPPHLMALHTACQHLALGTQEGGVQCWSFQGKRLNAESAHPSPTTALAFTADGKTLLTGNTDGTMGRYFVGASAGGRSPQIWSAHSASITSLVLATAPTDASNSTGARIFSSSLDGTLQLWSQQ